MSDSRGVRIVRTRVLSPWAEHESVVVGVRCGGHHWVSTGVLLAAFLPRAPQGAIRPWSCVLLSCMSARPRSDGSRNAGYVGRERGPMREPDDPPNPRSSGVVFRAAIVMLVAVVALCGSIGLCAALPAGSATASAVEAEAESVDGHQPRSFRQSRSLLIGTESAAPTQVRAFASVRSWATWPDRPPSAAAFALPGGPRAPPSRLT